MDKLLIKEVHDILRAFYSMVSFILYSAQAYSVWRVAMSDGPTQPPIVTDFRPQNCLPYFIFTLVVELV